jgi:histidyl-tRNA synthetase
VGGGGRYDDLIPLVGGKDIPASGFALYLDRLVDLIEHEGIEREFGRRILVGSGEDASGWRQCFDAAGLLRNNGYIAELDLGYQGEFDGRWLLLMGSGKTGSFLLVDQARGERLELRSIDEIIKILGERGCG